MSDSESVRASCSALRVVGDHPIMRRPDKVFRGENAEARAKVYASVLRDQGYENVTVAGMPNSARSGNAGRDLPNEESPLQ